MQIFQKFSSLINRFQWRRMWLIYILYSILSIFFIAYIFILQLLTNTDYLITAITFIAIVVLIPIFLLGLFALRNQMRLMEVILNGSGIPTDKNTESAFFKIHSINVLVDEIRSKTARIEELEKELEKMSMEILQPKRPDKAKEMTQKAMDETQEKPKEEQLVPDERRKYPRANQTVEVSFRDTESFAKAYITNVGGGGLFIKTNELAELNDDIIIRFTLPNQKDPITAEGKVIWVTPKGVKSPAYPPGIGIKFVHISFEDKHRLDDFVARALPQETPNK